MNRRVGAKVCAAFVLAACAPQAAPAAESSYRQVENWAQFPPGTNKWEAATGVDVDATGNVYVIHRNQAMPVIVFDRGGKFLRGWGQGMFKTTHFLRVDGAGAVWVTDRGDMQAFKFSPERQAPADAGEEGNHRWQRIAGHVQRDV